MVRKQAVEQERARLIQPSVMETKSMAPLPSTRPYLLRISSLNTATLGIKFSAPETLGDTLKHSIPALAPKVHVLTIQNAFNYAPSLQSFNWFKNLKSKVSPGTQDKLLLAVCL